MPHRRLCSAMLAALALLGTLSLLAGASQAHEAQPNDEPAFRYAIEEAHNVSLTLSGWEKAATLEQEGAHVSVEVVNERPALIHNVSVVFTGTPAGVEVTSSEAHASAPTPERAVLLPHVEARGTSSFGLGLDASAADAGGADLEALVLFEDASGTRHAAVDQLSLTIESSLAVTGPSATTGLLIAVGAALGLAAGRRR